MTRLLSAWFPTLSGRVNAALRIRALEQANRRLVQQNARLRRELAGFHEHRAAVRARLTSTSPTPPSMESAS